MSKEHEDLRKTIRDILEENSLCQAGINEQDVDPADSDKCSWMLFDEYGLRLLQRIGYKGDFKIILHRMRKHFEAEGWDFEEF